jgi:hypothetical protein
MLKIMHDPKGELIEFQYQFYQTLVSRYSLIARAVSLA